MKKQFFRILSCCVLLTCLCALPAYAQEPKAAQPASKEDKVVTDVTGSADLIYDPLYLCLFLYSRKFVCRCPSGKLDRVA